MSNLIKTGNIVIGGGSPLVLVSGPCVIEDYETTREIAGILKEITSKLEIPFIFKASYDKANRTSIAAFRGPGLNDGLRVPALAVSNARFALELNGGACSCSASMAILSIAHHQSLPASSM